MTLYPKLIFDALATVRYPGNGKNLMEAEMVADNSAMSGTHTFINLIFKGNNVTIPSSGIYKVILKIDEQLRESEFYVETKK